MATLTATRTLAINPAFLQEMKDSNPDLWETVHNIRQLCDSHDSTLQMVKRLTRLLDRLRDQLSLQFALEEAYGFLEIPGLQPQGEANMHHHEMVGKARDQHCELYLRLSELAEQAEELQYRGGNTAGLRNLVAASQDFDAKLRAHEQLEAELIEGLLD